MTYVPRNATISMYHPRMNTTRRKLLMISTDRSIFDEGSAVRVRQKEYAREWQEVHIIVFNTKKRTQIRGGTVEVVISNNCWAYSTNSLFKLWYPFSAIRLGRFIIAKRGITDITCQDPSLTAMAGVSLKKEFKLPLEIQIHADIGSPYFARSIGNKIRNMMARTYLASADSIRVVSERIRNFLISSWHVNEIKISVKPILVDVDAVRRAPILPEADLRKKYPQFDKIVLMASRLEPEKNIGLAIDAWKEVVKAMDMKAATTNTPAAARNIRVGMVIVGRGSEGPTLKAKCDEKVRQISIVFEEWADRDTLISYYKTADVFLNTSFFEGYGMTLVEAAAAGCKVISTDVGVAREVGATIISSDEPSDVADKIIHALDQK
jgi:glycosyltransferase involved in cell wall biosynthesis